MEWVDDGTHIFKYFSGKNGTQRKKQNTLNIYVMVHDESENGGVTYNAHQVYGYAPSVMLHIL